MRTPLSAEQMAILLSAEYAQECWRCCHRQGWPLSDIAGAVIISAIRTNGHLPEDKANHLRQQIMLICQAEWPDMPVNGNDIRARGDYRRQADWRIFDKTGRYLGGRWICPKSPHHVNYA
jgi:hypothetical protein